MVDRFVRASEFIRSHIASLGTAVAAEAETPWPEDAAVATLADLADALAAQDVDQLVRQLLRRPEGRRLLASAGNVVGQRLPAELAVVARAYVEAADEQLETWVPTPSQALKIDVDDLRERYLTALLDGNRAGASSMILAAVEAGLGVKDLYRWVFQPALYEVGRLWQRNIVTVAQEHYITAATQLIMSQLYPQIFSTDRRGRRLVATCVSGELHEVGVRMVADVFEMDGWDTYYLGASVPPDAVVDEVKRRRANVVGVSATLTAHIPEAAVIVELIRRDCAGVKTVVGGQAFALDPDAWHRIGADAQAPGADEAVTIANGWMDVG